MTKRGKRYIIIAAALGVFLILGITLFLRSYVIYNPIPFQKTKFNELVNWITKGKASNASVAIQLPQQYKRFSMTGKAYVTGNYIFIPTWLGRHTLLSNWLTDDKDCEGYLFVKNNLSYDEPAGDMNQVTIYIPVFSGHGISSPKRVTKSIMFVRSKVDSRWYVLESPPRSVLE